MALARLPNSQIVAQLTVPYAGTLRSNAVHLVPENALYDSLNVFIREDKIRSRPGLAPFTNNSFLEAIHGGKMIVTPTDRFILAVSSARVNQYRVSSSTWSYVDISGQSLSDGISFIDVATLETSGEYVALIASEGFPLRVWKQSPNTVATVTGTNIPSGAKSICIASSRVIALISPHTVVWSATLNYTSYDANAKVKRAQTDDIGICVKPLTTLAFVLYKERSIHTARAQAGASEATAFAFSEPFYIEGPAGPGSVVNVNGTHMYMTKNGRIAVFDGTRYPTWIADGLWIYLQNNIDQTFAHQIRGVYDYRLNTVTFYYPRISDNIHMKGMVIINLPFDNSSTLVKPAVFLGVCSKPITHGFEVRIPEQVDRSMVFNNLLIPADSRVPLIFDETVLLDDDTPFDCMIQTGIKGLPDARHTHTQVETFVERGYNYGRLKVEPITNDILENQSGTFHDVSAQIIDLENNPVTEYIGFNMQSRFFGLRYTWTSEDIVRYAGSVVYAS